MSMSPMGSQPNSPFKQDGLAGWSAEHPYLSAAAKGLLPGGMGMLGYALANRGEDFNPMAMLGAGALGTLGGAAMNLNQTQDFSKMWDPKRQDTDWWGSPNKRGQAIDGIQTTERRPRRINPLIAEDEGLRSYGRNPRQSMPPDQGYGVRQQRPPSRMRFNDPNAPDFMMQTPAVQDFDMNQQNRRYLQRQNFPVSS